mmetsp:Transcript_11000/g.39803  ORF Transcript_11000/g.39803 Transcript_11000/m.39803 type:complete len:280 (+) Transcript_11000:373-1212(+)
MLNAANSIPPPASALTVHVATIEFHRMANPPVAAAFAVSPAGGMTIRSFVFPSLSTMTREFAGFFVRRRGRVASKPRPRELVPAGARGPGAGAASKSSHVLPGAPSAVAKSPSSSSLARRAPRKFLPPMIPPRVETSASIASAAVWNRSSGEGSMSVATTLSSLGFSIWTAPRKLTFSRLCGRLAGERPASRNKIVAPAEYKSETGVTPPIICSGAQYPNVPTIVDPIPLPIPEASASDTAASAVAPKSTRLTSPVARSKRTLLGFTSRCTTGGRREPK